jgi:hypothetical protein
VVSFFLAFPPISYVHSSSPHSCYMPCPSHPPWLGMNYTFINLCPTPCHDVSMIGYLTAHSIWQLNG